MTAIEKVHAVGIIILGLAVLGQGIAIWHMATVSKEWQLAIQKDIFTYCPSPKAGEKAN